MKLDEEPLAADHGQFPDRLDVGGLPGGGQSRSQAKSPVDQEAPGFREVALRDEKVQVRELAEREVAVDQGGQGRALVRNRRDAMIGEQVEEPEQLAGHPEI